MNVCKGLFSLLLVLSAGCGSAVVELKGTVTLDGVAVDNASVGLLPEAAGGKSLHLVTDAHGAFSSPLDKVTKGAFKITVTKTASPDINPDWTPQQKMEAAAQAALAPAKPLLPLVYADASTTPLSCTLPPSGNVLKIELKSAP